MQIELFVKLFAQKLCIFPCMIDLSPFRNLDIDWNLSPEQAVTMYLEWGNNNWRGEHPPVRSKSDESIYFVVDAWQAPPMVRLVRRNSEQAEDLVAFPLPPDLAAAWAQEFGKMRCVSEPTPAIKDWLRQCLYS